MQLTANDRTLLFWTACLPARFLFASLFAPRYPTLARSLALLVGAKWTLGDGPAFGFFRGRAWWAELRPWHGVLWLVYAATGERDALYADVLLAATARTVYSAGS